MSPRLTELFLGTQTDERLVALARAGHERAFVAIVERYRPELQALARRLCADGRGEDVVQQAFLSAFAALRSGAEVKHLRGWLYRIVRNAAYRSRPPVCVPLDGATASAETVEDVVQQRALAISALTELARLPARQRQAMAGTVGGMARSEVASTMGLSEGAVRQLVHRARSTLRTAVTAVTPWPMARWFAALGQSTPGSAEMAVGAGTASSGGIVLKLGALVASGTLATGVAAVDLHSAGPHRTGPRAAMPGHAHASTHRAAPLVLAAVDPSPAIAAGSPQHSAGAPILEASRSDGHSGAGGVRVAPQRGRHEPGEERSGTRHDGSRGPDGGSGGHDGGTSSGGRDGSGGGGSQAGHGDSSLSGSGSARSSDGAGSSGGGDDGAHASDGPSVSIANAGSHQDRGEDTVTQSEMLDSGGDGSSSKNVSSSGERSGSGSGSSSGDGGTSGD